MEYGSTVSALIKAPLKINYDPLEAPSLERKNSFGVRGAPYLERRLLIRAKF